MSFFSNVCRLLSTLNGGIKHQRPTVQVPLSKVGLELSRLLANLGIIDDFAIGQRLSRLSRSHSRLWDPARTHIASSADAAGYPAMYLTLHINWDKHRPLWSRTPLPAQQYLAAPMSGSSCSSSSQSPRLSASASASASATPPPPQLPDPQLFTPPMGLNSPTPESITLLSRPSAQRCIGLKQLLAARKQSRPGIFLVSTPQGLLTDIDCELRGMGGTLLAHLGLPLSHVIQLRGLLRSKYLAELAAALPPGTQPLTATGTTALTVTAAGEEGGDDAAARRAWRRAALQGAKLRAQHVPLSEWDARAAAAAGINARLQAASDEAHALLTRIESSSADFAHDQLEGQARQLLVDLEVQEKAWQQQQQQGGSGSNSRSSRDAAGGSSRDARSSSRGGDDEGEVPARRGRGTRRQSLF